LAVRQCRFSGIFTETTDLVSALAVLGWHLDRMFLDRNVPRAPEYFRTGHSQIENHLGDAKCRGTR
jgi:hypothetical protein